MIYNNIAELLQSCEVLYQDNHILLRTQKKH